MCDPFTTAACIGLVIAGALQSIGPRPPLDAMPLSVTSYWFYDEDGQPVAWKGQADGDPSIYGNSYPTDISHAGRVGACIQELVRRVTTHAFTFTWRGQLITIHCYDTFGKVSYRRPFYHNGYGRWVIPIDILSPTPYHGLVSEWSLSVVEVGSIDK